MVIQIADGGAKAGRDGRRRWPRGRAFRSCQCMASHGFTQAETSISCASKGATPHKGAARGPLVHQAAANWTDPGADFLHHEARPLRPLRVLLGNDCSFFRARFYCWGIGQRGVVVSRWTIATPFSNGPLEGFQGFSNKSARRFPVFTSIHLPVTSIAIQFMLNAETIHKWGHFYVRYNISIRKAVRRV